MKAQDGNGEAMPCYIERDCPLLKEQEAGNGILTQMLTELKTLNESLVGPATGRRQVPASVFGWCVGLMFVLVLFLLVRDSNRDVHLGGEKGLHIERRADAEGRGYVEVN